MPKILSTIIPDNNSSFPTHEDIYGKGGYVVIQTTTELPFIENHITPFRRKEGMLVYDITEQKFYQCTSVEGSGSDNDFWPELDLIGGSQINLIDGYGTRVVEYPNGDTQINLRATLGELNNVDDAVDDLGANGDNWVLKWDAANLEWIAGPVSVTVEGSTDGVFAQIDEPYVTWTSAKTDLTNSLTIGEILVGGEGILIDPTTDHTLTFSIDQNVVVLYEDMPKYTDGSLDVARQSTLESLVDLLNSFGTTDCPVGGGGILGIEAGTNITINGPAAVPVVNLSSIVTNTTFTGSTYNELDIVRVEENLLLTYPTSDGQANISIKFNANFGATFSTSLPDTEINFRNLHVSGKQVHEVAYLDDLYVSELRDVVITTALVPGSILTYVDGGLEQYWTNTNEISGGNASSF